MLHQNHGQPLKCNPFFIWLHSCLIFWPLPLELAAYLGKKRNHFMYHQSYKFTIIQQKIHFYLHIIDVSFQCNYRVNTFTKLRAVPWLCSSLWFHYYWGKSEWFLPLQTSSANSWICFSIVSESDTFAMSNKVIKLYII